MKDKCVNYLKQPLICSFVLNLGIILLLFLLYDFHWETNDDVYMSSIVYGTYGQYDEHLVFINILIGRLIKQLLIICSVVPWYGVLQAVIVFVSFVIIVYRIFDIRLDFEMLAICTIIVYVMGLQFYVQMQFTKTAGIASIAGILLVFRFCAQRKGKNWLSFIIGLAMCAVGVMYRGSSFYLALGMLFVLGGYELIYYWKYSWVKTFFRYGLCALLLLILMKGLVAYNSYECNKEDGYTEYIQFSRERGQLTDYYWPDYYDNKSGYDKLGISAEDIEFYNTWNFADKDIVNIDNLKVVNGFKQNEDFKEYKSINDFMIKFFSVYMGYSFIVVPILILLIGIRKKRYRIFSLLSIVTFIILQVYLYYKGRVFIQRVDAVFVMALIATLSVALAYEEENSEVKVFGIGIILLPVFLILPHIQYNTDNVNKISEEDQQQWIEYLQDNKQTLFVMENWTNVMLWNSIYSIWSVPPKGLAQNVYILGGWQYQSPNTNDILANYKVKNPFIDMVDNKSIKFVQAGDTDEFKKYIERHYYTNVEFSVVNKIGNCLIYECNGN